MSTVNSIRQKLIDRVQALAATSAASDINFLSKTLDQVEGNPKHLALNRVNIENAELNEGGLDRERAAQSTSTTEISPLGGGIHVQQQTRSDGEMNTLTNYENNKSIRDDARPQFAIWSAHNNSSGGGISYDQYLRPYERKGYKDTGGHYHTGGDGGPAAGVYSTYQKEWAVHTNECYLRTNTHAGSGNTTTAQQYPSGTDAVGECGHYRIKMGYGGAETCRMKDYGDAFRYENVEVGTCELEHRQSYMKLQGRWIHLREKWMPGTHVTWASQDTWSQSEFRGSPSMYQVNMKEATEIESAYGSITYNKTRQELAVVHQLVNTANSYNMKIWTNVAKIDRLTCLEDVLKEENAVYVNFAWGTGFGTGTIEAQRCSKITMTDNGEVYGTLMKVTDIYALGKIDNTWRANSTQSSNTERALNIVYDIIVTKPGKGYTSAPILTIAPPAEYALSGNTNGTTAIATCSVSGGRVLSTTISNNGSYYDYYAEPHPVVTVDNSAAGGTGAEFVAVLRLTGAFINIDSQSIGSSNFGRDSGPYGQRIVMSRNRKVVYHYCQWDGLRTGIRSYIIDKVNNAWCQGQESQTLTNFGYQVVAFGEQDFYVNNAQDWDNSENHSGFIWYQKAPWDGTSASWTSDDVGKHLDLIGHSTQYPAVVPIF
jgi:hypothetical protein